MRLTNTIVFITILLPTFLFSQNEDLNTLMSQLAKEIKQVESKKYTYEQALTFDSNFPFRASLEATRIDTKGKSKSQTHDFNLKDFDKNSVRKKNVKDVLVVQLNVDRKQKFIGITIDGKRDKYTNELEFIATDVDNARVMIELLKKIIPLSKSAPPTELVPATYEARLAWLEKNITKAEKDGKTIEQKIKPELGFKTRLVFETEQEGKKETQNESYGFNLIDIQGKKMKLEVKGKNIFMKVNMKEKYVRYKKNNALGNFKKDFKIYVPTIEMGKNIVTVFQALAEESPKQVKELAAKGNLSIGSADDGKNIFYQKMEGQCLMTFESNYENKKGETINDKSILHLDDMNPKSVKIKVNKKTIWVNSSTDKSKKYIHTFKNDEVKGFSKKIGIRATNIENARVLEKQLKEAIENCEGKSDCAASNQSIEELMNFVKNQITDIKVSSKSFQQKIELTNDHPNQWNFTRTESKKKGEEEKSFIFNLSDIDPKRIDFSISKKTVVVKLHTSNGEENIKTYKNSEPDSYEKKLEIYVSDIATARKLVCALKAAIEKI